MSQQSDREVNYNIKDRAPTGLLGRLSPLARDSVMVAVGMMISATMGLVLLQKQAPNVSPAQLEALHARLDESESTRDKLQQQVMVQTRELLDLQAKLAGAGSGTSETVPPRPRGKILSILEVQERLL